MSEQGRDLTWDAMATVAERMDAESESYTVLAARRRFLLRWTIEEGLLAFHEANDHFELVRARPFFSESWIDHQPVQEAAAKIGQYLRTNV